MKKAFYYSMMALLLTALLAVGACSQKTEKHPYTISCDDSEVLQNNTRAYLYDLALESIVDSVDIIDGIFCFNGEVDTPFFASVSFDNNPWLGWYVYVEPGDMKLKDVTMFASGTENNDAMGMWCDDIMGVSASDMNTVPDPEKEVQYITDHHWEMHSHDIVGGLMVTMLIDVLPFQKIDSMIAELPAEVRSDRYIAKCLKEFEQRRNIQPNHHFIDLPLTTLDGDAVKLSDYVGNGDIVLVDFWASWCGPCRRAIAEMQAMLPHHKELKVLGIAVSDVNEDTRNAIEAMKITWPVICDTTNNAITTYGISGIPFLMLIDRDGTILGVGITEEELEALLVEKGI